MKKDKKRTTPPFSATLFVLIICVTLLAYAEVVKIFAPSVWAAETSASLFRWVVVFFVGHLAGGFVEFGFHRYMLHSPFPFFGRLYRQHTLHHGLTNVKWISVGGSDGKVFNRYPILEEKQNEASYFPWYSMAGFIIFTLPITIPIQMLLPSWPIILGSGLAIACSITLYEIIHCMEHLSFEGFWRPKLEDTRWGNIWTAVYCFHLRHHDDIRSNENISGFFGIPVADLVLGTYAKWPHAFSDGQMATREDFEVNPPRPCRLIRLCDYLLIRTPVRI